MNSLQKIDHKYKSAEALAFEGIFMIDEKKGFRSTSLGVLVPQYH